MGRRRDCSIYCGNSVVATSSGAWLCSCWFRQSSKCTRCLTGGKDSRFQDCRIGEGSVRCDGGTWSRGWDGTISGCIVRGISTRGISTMMVGGTFNNGRARRRAGFGAEDLIGTRCCARWITAFLWADVCQHRGIRHGNSSLPCSDGGRRVHSGRNGWGTHATVAGRGERNMIHSWCRASGKSRRQSRRQTRAHRTRRIAAFLRTDIWQNCGSGYCNGALLSSNSGGCTHGGINGWSTYTTITGRS